MFKPSTTILATMLAVPSLSFGMFVDTAESRGCGHLHECEHKHEQALIHEHYRLGLDDPGRIDPSPGKWGDAKLGTPASVTWSFMESGLETDGGPNASVALREFLPIGFQSEIERAFDSWSRYVGIEFVKVEDPKTGWVSPGAYKSDIRIGGQLTDGIGGIIANGFFPPENGGAAAGDIHLDVEEDWKIGFGGSGYDIFQTMTHEIGHAIGLAHTDLVNSLMNPLYTEAFSGPQMDDIIGARKLYGRSSNAVPNEGRTLAMFSIAAFFTLALKFYLNLKKRPLKKRTRLDSLHGVASV